MVLVRMERTGTLQPDVKYLAVLRLVFKVRHLQFYFEFHACSMGRSLTIRILQDGTVR